jgi:hypothetical protein
MVTPCRLRAYLYTNAMVRSLAATRIAISQKLKHIIETRSAGALMGRNGTCGKHISPCQRSGGIPATKAATDVNEALILGAADFATDMVDLFCFCDWSIWRWQWPSGSADAIQKSNQAG